MSSKESMSQEDAKKILDKYDEKYIKYKNELNTKKKLYNKLMKDPDPFVDEQDLWHEIHNSKGPPMSDEELKALKKYNSLKKNNNEWERKTFSSDSDDE